MPKHNSDKPPSYDEVVRQKRAQDEARALLFAQEREREAERARASRRDWRSDDLKKSIQLLHDRKNDDLCSIQ